MNNYETYFAFLDGLAGGKADMTKANSFLEGEFEELDFKSACKIALECMKQRSGDKVCKTAQCGMD